ncbi:alpha/beta hydrolase [Amycolatopsis anabasis]|uniref:alpha/beta hydrolase n=1 Tax=Amycolatopsis anabasis TaxID=1840409 RepID=UPI00131D3E37|nr:alpha/beta hydrolase [Amycolatopsis anabasis]
MDQIRKALGEQRISYYGTSYGTYLGPVYARLFPGRGDRFLLDSAADPKMIWREQFRNWGLGTELRFPDFGKWAAARHGVYQLGRTADEVRGKYFELASALDAAPVGGVNGDMFRQLTRSKLYSDHEFPALAQLWQDLGRSGATAPGAAVATAASPPVPDDNFIAAHLAVTCGDVSWPRSLAHYQRAVRIDRQRFPMVGGMTANITPRARWPLAPREKPTEITGDGPENLLILQNLRDPATIYTGGVHLRQLLGDRTKLVSIDQGGHVVYPGNNTCADDLATRFLVDGVVPIRDRFCSAETPPAP